MDSEKSFSFDAKHMLFINANDINAQIIVSNISFNGNKLIIRKSL